MEFCKCGSFLINGKCSNDRCPGKSQKHKDWVVEGRSMGFKRPVTHDEAADLARRLNLKEKNQ